MPEHANQYPHGNRCEVCEASFTTEALLNDHRKTHEPGANVDAIQERQNERKP